MAESISNSRLAQSVDTLMTSGKTRNVFITGGTGYIGKRLIPTLLERGHRVRALARPGSQGKLAPGCEVVPGDALDARTYAHCIHPCDTFIQLVGTPHPSPAKTAEFLAVDLVSGREAIGAATELRISHFIYLSVAQPAPMMKSYIAVRAACEQMIQERHLNATILRPWYVLGPGHRWPYVLVPFYKAAEVLPFTRAGAQRLGLVTLEQMVWALVEAVESPVQGTRVMTVPDIRGAQSHGARHKAGQTR